MEKNEKAIKVGETPEVKYFRKSNILALMDAIKGDQFFDSGQYDYKGELDSRYPGITDFLVRNVKEGMILEVGPGSGYMTDVVPADYYLDPGESMLARLREKLSKRKIKKDPVIQEGVIEYIPWDIAFDTIFFINGLFQVRSTNEALIEVNSHLKMGGVFIFNLKVADSEDIICGRVHGPSNYLRNAKEYGFSLVEFRKDLGYFALEKVRDFKVEYLRKLQLVPRGDMGWDVYNLFRERDWSLL